MKAHDEFWINGVRKEHISAADRGLELGDGLFETMRYYQGNLIALDYHLKRLAIGLKELFFPDSLSRVTSDLNIVLTHLTISSWEDAVIRVTVSRGTGARGYVPATSSSASIVIKASTIDFSPMQQSSPMKVETGDFKLSIQPRLAGIKHTNRLEQILASIEQKQKNVDELLLLNIDDLPIGFVSGNLFIREHKTLLTPKLESSGIEGTRRSLILSTLATESGYSAYESDLSMERIFSADELMFCNAVHGIRSVHRLDNKEWTDYSASRALHESYIRGYLK